MWLQSELSPYFADGRLTHSEFFGQSITTPMRRPVARTASRQFQEPRLGRRTTSPVLVTTVARSQANQTLLNEALLPNANVSISATQSTTNLTVGMPSGQEQNQFCSFPHPRRQRSAPCTALQLPAFRRSQYQPIPIHALNLSEMLYESRTYYTRIASTRRFSKCMIALRCSAAKEPVPVFYHCRGRRKSRTRSAGINPWNRASRCATITRHLKNNPSPSNR